MKEEFSLVLSGGGALGIAHLGIIKQLENKKYNIQEIIGTSMGGIIGAGIAIGLPVEKIFEILSKFSKIKNFATYVYNSNSIIDTKKIEDTFNEVFEDRRMKDTMIPLKLVATNLRTGHAVCFDEDSDVLIKDALLATMAIPGVFNEKLIDGDYYFDGFLSENLAVNRATKDKILAVDVLGFKSYTNELPNHFFKTQNVLKMFEKSLRLLVFNQTMDNIDHSDKEIHYIDLETKDYKSIDFDKYESIYKIGLEYNFINNTLYNVK